MISGFFRYMYADWIPIKLCNDIILVGRHSLDRWFLDDTFFHHGTKKHPNHRESSPRGMGCVYDFVNLSATSIKGLNARSWNPSHTRCWGIIPRNHPLNTIPRSLVEDSTRQMYLSLFSYLVHSWFIQWLGVDISRWRATRHRHSYRLVDRIIFCIRFDVETLFRSLITFLRTIVWRSLAHRASLQHS